MNADEPRERFPRHPNAAVAIPSAGARTGARNSARAAELCAAAVCAGWPRGASRKSARCPGIFNGRRIDWPRKFARLPIWESAACCCSAFRTRKMRSAAIRTAMPASCSKAIRAVKQAAPNLLVITDVCFCEYTDHGHCGVLNEKTGRMDVDNDATLELLAQAGRQPRPGRGRPGRPQRHDGRHGAERSARGSIEAASRTCRS